MYIQISYYLRCSVSASLSQSHYAAIASLHTAMQSTMVMVHQTQRLLKGTEAERISTEQAHDTIRLWTQWGDKQMSLCVLDNGCEMKH